MPLRIPRTWMVLDNGFADVDPVVRDGRIANEPYFQEDLLSLERVHYTERGWEREPGGHVLDLGWYPSGDPDGAYRVSLIHGDWDHVVFERTSRDRAEIRDVIDRALRMVTNGVEDAEITRALGRAWEPTLPGGTLVRETWELHDNCRDSWMVEHGPLADPRESNAIMARMLELSLRALAPLARPILIGFGTVEPVPEGALSHRSFRRPDDEPAEAIIAPACAALAAFPYPVYAVEVPLELHVWVHTDGSPDEPVRVWVHLADELHVSTSVSGDEGPYAVLHIFHTLFHPFTRWEAPHELHALNHPVLEQVLREWDRVLGPVQPLEPWEGITPFGYDAAGF